MSSPLDEALAGRVRALLASQPSHAHLHDEAWLALADGRSLPDGGAALEHLARCAECRDVLRAVRLLREEVPHRDDAFGSPAPRRPRWLAAAVGLAAMVIVGGGAWLMVPAPERIAPTGTTATEANSQAPPVPSPPVAGGRALDGSAARALADALPLTPPAIAIYSPGALTMRGSGDATFTDAFGEAMRPWAAGQYADVARRLDALRGRHPDVAEVPFYQGAALLLAGQPEASVEHLARALALAPPALRADAAWYLALAHVHTGRRGEAQVAMRTSCDAGRQAACAALPLFAAGALPSP